MSAQTATNTNAPSSATTAAPAAANWTPESWRTKTIAQEIPYEDKAALQSTVERLQSLPPLVTSWEIESLRERLADAARGRRFVLQGGDCAETFDACRPERITAKLKILLQMGLVLSQGLKRPIVKVGRFAGQYAKPRSSPREMVKMPDGSKQEMMSYYGDMINSVEADEAARQPDPARLITSFQYASMTLNFIRSLIDGGFADLHHPENWELSFLDKPELPEELRTHYREITAKISNAIAFMEAVGDGEIHNITATEFYTSHEGLNLAYESALTRQVPRRTGYYNLSCHLPWIGERTRQIDGAHVEFFRGIRNPVGVKIGPSITPDELLQLADAIDPHHEEGRLTLIVRVGAGKGRDVLPPLLRAMKKEGRQPLWLCDPMHANTKKTSNGTKTRHFDDILSELREAIEVHAQEDSILGGVHFELTGENVTECVGGMAGIGEGDLDINYETLCDPRLNYEQAMELAFAIAKHLGN